MTGCGTAPLILASASPQRLRLLQQLGITPDQVLPAGIDEMPIKAELPDKYVLRMAKSKAASMTEAHPEAIVLAADTAVACGRRILPKAEDEKQARQCLKLLSGRRHRIYTAICVRKAAFESYKLVMTQVRFSPFVAKDIDTYLASEEWKGKAGGYAIQGRAEAFIPWINGSYSNVVGLPLAETAQLLKAAGYAW